MHMYYLSLHTCRHTGRSVSLLRMRRALCNPEAAASLPALPLCQGAAEEGWVFGVVWFWFFFFFNIKCCKYIKKKKK